MINLKSDSFVLDNRIVPKINTYPISTPMPATGNQYSPSVYAAQVNKSKQIEAKLVAVKVSSLCDSKKDVKVGINE